jgi:hypothetical protein
MDETENFFAKVEQAYFPTSGDAPASGVLTVLHGSGSAEAIAKRVMASSESEPAFRWQRDRGR